MSKLNRCLSLQQDAAHYAIGLKILYHLVSDINQSFWYVAQQKLQELALSLSLQCLSFDFMGISADESSDDAVTSQMPLSWRSVLEEPSTIQIYFDYYAITTPPLSNTALECLVGLLSVRRSFFTNNGTRMQYLTTFMMGTTDILETGKGYPRYLWKPDAYEFNFIVVVCCIKIFWIPSFQWTSSSVFYLLALWSKMLTSLPLMKNSNSNFHIDEFVPKILEGFISSRLDSLQSVFSDDLSEDPLDNLELMQDQLECLPYLFRFQVFGFNFQWISLLSLSQYRSSSTYLTNIMDPVLQEYMEGAKLQDYVTSNNVAVVETKLAWMVHIVGAIMKIKNYAGGVPNEVIDADLSARVLQLINFMDTGSYVQQLYVRLSELLGLHDHLLVLDIMIQKFAKNLKFCSERQEVLRLTLSLFLEMTTGYGMGKFLLKLDTIKYITSNHSAFVDLESIPDPLFRDETVKCALVGLMRDLRGITMATSSRKTYGFLFDWLYPAHIRLLLKAVATWADCPEVNYQLVLQVTTSLLKFIAELVQNKAQRLTFDQSSPNSILLFQEVSKVLVAYGSRVLTLPSQKDVYRTKYKGIWVSLTILTKGMY
ncbi:Ran-binding protein 17 [Bienertia sinuspersici]